MSICIYACVPYQGKCFFYLCKNTYMCVCVCVCVCGFLSTNGYATPPVHFPWFLVRNINSFENFFQNFLKFSFAQEHILWTMTKG